MLHPIKFNNFSNFLFIIISFILLMLHPSFGQEAPDVNFVRDSNIINWPGASPEVAEYKDVQAVRDANGDLLLYMPVTRPPSGDFNDKLFILDTATNRFVDQTASLLPFLNPSIARDTYDVDFLDIDGDRDLDIIHSSPHGNFIYVNRRNEATGSFTDETNSRLPALLRTDGQDVWDDVTVICVHCANW